MVLLQTLPLYSRNICFWLKPCRNPVWSLSAAKYLHIHFAEYGVRIKCYGQLRKNNAIFAERLALVLGIECEQSNNFIQFRWWTFKRPSEWRRSCRAGRHAPGESEPKKGSQ